MNPKLIFMKNALERFFYVVDVFKTSFKRLCSLVEQHFYYYECSINPLKNIIRLH